MISHTPGPWETDCKDHDCIYQDILVRAASRSICKLWIDDAPVHDYNAEQHANAQLIAAAPELLDALRWYVENDDTNVQQDGNEFYTAGLRRAEAIIAKATGGQ
jgi:hypothetical protein